MDTMAELIADTTMGTIIHPTAFVDSRADIGARVSIGPFCTVGPDVAIGDGVELEVGQLWLPLAAGLSAVSRDASSKARSMVTAS